MFLPPPALHEDLKKSNMDVQSDRRGEQRSTTTVAGTRNGVTRSLSIQKMNYGIDAVNDEMPSLFASLPFPLLGPATTAADEDNPADAVEQLEEVGNRTDTKIKATFQMK